MSIKKKMRLGFFVIVILTFLLGHAGFVGVTRIRYAAMQQSLLTEIVFKVSEILHLESEIMISGNIENIDEVNRVIEDLLSIEDEVNSKWGTLKSLEYYVTLFPKEMVMQMTFLWENIHNLIVKVSTLNELLDKRFGSGGLAIKVNSKGEALSSAFFDLGWKDRAYKLDLLRYEAISEYKPKLINRIVELLDNYANEIKRSNIPKVMKSRIFTLINDYKTLLLKIKDIDIKIIETKSSFEQIAASVLDEGNRGVERAKDMVTRAIIFTISLTTLIFIAVFIFSLIVSSTVIRDVSYSLHKLIEAIKQAKEGNFNYEITIRKKNDEMAQLSDWFNKLLASFRENVGFIIEKSKEAIASKIIPTEVVIIENGNPLVKARNIVDMLVRINKYKSVIEGDYEKRQIYKHLVTILERDFGVDDCIVFELNESKNRFEPVFDEDHERVPLDIIVNPDLCRAKRTSEIVNALDFPDICPFSICSDELFSICIPVVMGGEVKGVVKIIEKRENESILISNLPYIVKYVETTAPVVYASKLLEITREQALRDGLTGLYNRRFLEIYLDKYVKFAMRKGYIIGFLMIDIDRFKRINDTYGHKNGDMVLKEVAHIIESSVRASDIVIRYGGEEFLVILPEVAKGKTFEVGEKIRRAVEIYDFDIEGKKIKVTVSVGVAEFPTHSNDPNQVIKFADIALYQAKRAGRNRTVLFSEDMWKKAEDIPSQPLPSDREEDRDMDQNHIT